MNEKDYYYILKTIKKYIPEQEAQEVLHEVILQVLENPPQKLTNEYIIRACFDSYYSKTSPYARKKLREVLVDYKDIDAIEEIEEDNLPIDICKYIDEVEGLSWWEKECVKRKNLEGKTFRELSIEYNIPGYTIQYSYKKAIKKIREKYESSNR